MGKEKAKRGKDSSRIELSAPWGAQQRRISNTESAALEEAFIRQRSNIHLQYIIEENKTKRMALVISVLLVIAGGLILVYAPRDNRMLANFIGIALVLAAGGAAGYRRLWFRSAKRQLLADSDNPPIPAETPSKQPKKNPRV